MSWVWRQPVALGWNRWVEVRSHPVASRPGGSDWPVVGVGHDHNRETPVPDFSYRTQSSRAAPILPLRAEGLVWSASGKRLVDVENLVLASGGPTMLMGPNGAGKSLLLRILHGLIEPIEGRVSYGGRSMNADIRRRQAMVFQRPLVLRRSVASNLAFALKVHGIPGARRQERVDQLLEIGDLAGRARQAARTLSGGEQQRLMLLRAISTDPEILFLDEPTSSLDPSATQKIENLVLRAVSDRGVKVVMVTHDAGQARRLSSEVVFMHQGRITEQTVSKAFFERPRSEPARRFLSGALLL